MNDNQNPVDLGFQSDFLECLADEAFYILNRDLPVPLRDLCDNAFAIYSLLLMQARGYKPSELDLKELPFLVGELTKQIWEHGGKFGNSCLEYSKKDG